jgi:HTH-type transcriptional regulator, sugar sensing transcriptional regulator
MARTRNNGVVLTSSSSAPEGLVTRLEGLGLSRNEALAYLTLLEALDENGLTGYEVASRSSIPRSAVYTVLRKLQSAGAAFAYGEKPERFVATEPEQWLDQVRRGANTRIVEAAQALANLPKRPRPEPVWILRRYDEVMRRIDQMIRGAEQSVWLSMWSRELEVLRPALDAIGDRTLHRVLHSPASIQGPPPGFSCWTDSVEHDEGKSHWAHKALVVIDRREALIGGTEPLADNHAVLTTNPSIVDVATNHIILDITLMARRKGVDPDQVVSPMMRPHLLPLVLESGELPVETIHQAPPFTH